MKRFLSWWCARRRGTDSPRFRDIAWPLESDGWALDSWRAFDQWAPRRWQQDTCFPSKRRGPGSSGVDIQLSALINPVHHWSLIFYLHAGFHVSQKEQELIVDNLYSLLTVSLVFVPNGTHNKKSCCQKFNFSWQPFDFNSTSNTLGELKLWLALIVSLTSLDTKVSWKTVCFNAQSNTHKALPWKPLNKPRWMLT